MNLEGNNKKILVSAIVVLLVVLVAFNFEEITGQATVGSEKYTRKIIAPNTVYGGKTIPVSFEPKPGRDLINIGGSYKETLWLKGPSVTKEITNIECVKGYTGSCEKVETKSPVWFSPNWEKGKYYLTVEKTTPTTREVLSKKTITLR